MVGSSSEPQWIDKLIVEAIHLDQIRVFGGLHGLRNEGGLDSALSRPKHRWHYENNNDLATLTAAYGFGICRNHPFNDGNKRTAFVVMATFAELNGYELIPSEADVVTQMLKVASGDLSEDDLATWIRNHGATTSG